MATIGIFDWDFMTYEHVIPNLECAKLYTYYHNYHEIAVLTPTLNPAPYTHFYIRKEYDDGCYPQLLFADNCNYGGRAFNPLHYHPLPEQIERTIPIFTPYLKYTQKFGTTKYDKSQIRHILNCAHIRLSTDEQKPKSLKQLLRITDTGRYTGIIFHDYDLARIQGAYDIIYELSHTRTYKTKTGINPYAIGNKFPIQVNNTVDLMQWLKVLAMPNLFCLQYNGVMPDDALYTLCTENIKMARQVYYNITASCYTENQFFVDILPKIFLQVLFLRRMGIKILLKYDEQKIVTPALQNLLNLLNCWLRFTYFEDSAAHQSLYQFCATTRRKMAFQDWKYQNVNVSIDQMRDAFQYVRERNYDLFKLFYEIDTVSYKGGYFVQ